MIIIIMMMIVMAMIITNQLLTYIDIKESRLVERPALYEVEEGLLGFFNIHS